MQGLRDFGFFRFLGFWVLGFVGAGVLGIRVWGTFGALNGLFPK